jgi:anti-sigma B factor antagonist
MREEVHVLQSSAVTGSIAPSSCAKPAPFVCRWRLAASGAVWVRVAGALDPTTSPQLGQTLMEAQLSVHLVVLDLRELTSIDSSGIQAILDAAYRGRRHGGRLTLVRGSGEIDRELMLNGVCDHLLVFDLHPAEPAETLLKVG